MIEYYRFHLVALPPARRLNARKRAAGSRPKKGDAMVVSPSPTCDAMVVLKDRIKAWMERGWKIKGESGSAWLEVHAPATDKGWRECVQEAIDAGALDPKLSASGPPMVMPEYQDGDRAAAKMFKLFHSGRYISTPTGRDRRVLLSHLAEFDVEPRCPKCGGGVRQTSSLRIAASELDRCNKLGSIWVGANAFYLLADELVMKLEKAVGEPLPKRAVEATGARNPKQRWWQLDPAESLPSSAVRQRQSEAVPCKQRGCGRVYESSEEKPSAVYIERYVSPGLPRRLPVCAWSPLWQGAFEPWPDGRVADRPSPVSIYLRRDLALAWQAEKVHGVELTPLLMAKGGWRPQRG